MFSEPIIIPTENNNDEQFNANDPRNEKNKKIIIFSLIGLGILILIASAYFIFKKNSNAKNSQADNNKTILINDKTIPTATSSAPVLPDFSSAIIATSTTATTSFSDLVIDYLSFADFYKKPDNTVIPKFTDFQLPLNVKLDVLNYYDTSRKINLDPGLDSLNTNGFALIDNPYDKETPGFYAAYEKLESQQVSPLITSDFIIYYYQNNFKKVFKDIEENVFYDNLWSINKDLYTAAKNRYEARLAAIGDVNDSILEGERLEMAFFAVSLELLKPTSNQLAQKGTLNDKSKFLATEVDNFYFVLPPYLRDDVMREEKLIREAKTSVKSPVLLYMQNYNDFIVPAEYSTNAKLNNFYLTTKWLNSVFPLNYRDKNCPNCLLDKEDWRINFIAASLIADDAANLPDLKNKWARVYKVMSFFKGLREDFNYIHYRDSLSSEFGVDYNITELFDDKNKFAAANLEKLKTKLLTYKMSAIQGAYSQTDPAQKPKVGFKMLAESYWPNDYLFTHLSAPNVTNYLSSTTKANNITACSINNVLERCSGIALDIINLVAPVANNDYFVENTNYLNYGSESDKLRADLNKNTIWPSSNYWSTLGFIRTFINIDKNIQPLMTQSSAWQKKSFNTATAAWINMQLPLEKFSVNLVFKGTGLNNYSNWSDNIYIEPNLNLINELQANNAMVLKMINALQLDKEINSAAQSLNAVDSSLSILKSIILKELQGEILSQDDKDALANFAKQLKIDKSLSSNSQLTIKFPMQRINFKGDLGHLKLLVLVHQAGDSKIISVGPVWDYRESK